MQGKIGEHVCITLKTIITERLDIKMSNFTKDDQTKVVKQAMELENAILKGQRELSRLERETFQSAPDKPVKKVAKRVPPVTPDYSALPKVDYTFEAFLEDNAKANLLNKLFYKIFSVHPFKRSFIIVGIFYVLLMITIFISTDLFRIFTDNSFFTFIGLIVGICSPQNALIYWLVKKSAYKKKIEELTAALPQTPEYIQAKAEADRIAQEKQAAIDEDLKNQQASFDSQYAKEKEQYDTVVLPKYQAELSAWTTEHDKRIKAVKDKLDADCRAQSELYTTTKIIPMQYRDIEALTYLYQLMSTSDYDLKEAVDMYDKELQRQQEAERIRQEGQRVAALQRANALAEEQNYRLGQQNDLLDEQNRFLNEQNYLQHEQNEIAEKQRADDRRREIETEYHRHQIRKNLKNRR